MSKVYKGTKAYAIILGGSSGIGLATVKKLAKEGFNIVSIYRERKSRLKELEPEMNELRTNGTDIRTFNLNALKQDTIDAVVAEILSEIGVKSVKLILHSIANGNLKPLRLDVENQTTISHDEDITSEVAELFTKLKTSTSERMQFMKRLTVDDFAYTINAMATNLLDWSNAFLDNQLFADDARIIGLTSEGTNRIWKGYAAVSGAKAVLESLIRHMALEYAPHGVTANLIQAGITDTPSLRLIPGNEIMRASSNSRNPFGRLTTPDDIANTIYLLSRSEASWINGTTIVADGGEHLCP